MEYNHPDRPRINNQPAYGDENHIYGVLPRLQLTPKSHDLTLVSAILAVDYNVFREFSAYSNTSMIPDLMRKFMNDPEKFFENFFDYSLPSDKKKEKEKIVPYKFEPRAVQTKKSNLSNNKKAEISLSDLF